MKKIQLSLFALASIALAFTASVASAKEYKFTLENKTQTKITKLLVSEDGKEWGYFDIGKGIAAGDEVQLVWDKSTDNSSCEWKMKAKFADGSESEVSEHDFCEGKVELVYE